MARTTWVAALGVLIAAVVAVVGLPFLRYNRAQGRADLRVAIRKGDIETVDRLTRRDPVLADEADGNPDIFLDGKEPKCSLPLTLAVLCDRPAIAELLVLRGARQRSETYHPPLGSWCRGVTPLHLAVMCNNTRLATFFLDHGAEVNPSEASQIHFSDSVPQVGGTPLHCAAEAGLPDMAALLLSRGASVDARDNLGRTPLHLAARQGSVKVIARLLESGANADRRDDSGQTPLQLALQEGQQEAAARLRSR